MCIIDSFLATEDFLVSDLKDERLWTEFGVAPVDSASGITVTPERALGLSAYYDALRIISEDVAKLPFIVYRRLVPRGKERAPEHPVFPLLKTSPHANMHAMSWRETMTAHALGWGGGFSLITRNGRGVPVELQLVHPSRVETKVDDEGRLFYIVAIPDTQESMIVRQVDMFHLHGLSPDGMNGYSVARIGANSLGRGLAAEQFSASFFRSGSSPRGVLKTMHKFDGKSEGAQRLRRQWQEQYSGPQGWNKPIILEQGMEWQSTSVNPEDAQLIETEQFSVLEVARWFRIAPHKLGHLGDASFTNVEDQNRDHVTDTLMPWLERWESESQRKLFIGDGDEFFAEHLVTALLRGNSEARSAFHREMFNIGAVSQNDIREAENMNPIGPEGDVYYVQGQLVRSQDAAEGRTGATLDPPAGRTDGNDNAPRAELRETQRAVLLGVFSRLRKREEKAIEKALRRSQSDEELGVSVSAFYEKHAVYLRNDLTPVATALLSIVGRAPSAEAVVANEVARYVTAVTAEREAAGLLRALDLRSAAAVDSILKEALGQEEEP